ncbi:hypothetical protein ESA94_18225 [Lacibacter luteus]|uniref:Outer membrane protein beta-barrel domain-containing protein n=1 Tax=Lacibacter luteus TaxID=2508719 RepID=A0A4Q1CFJ5_9BACT|nr:hypothetical protein [Lacibacter luteus]RXK58569.1 hypothetical protein ESA94_18225 [Lacibacter luteus]
MRSGSFKHPLLILFLTLFFAATSKAQDSSLFNRILSFPDKVFGRIDKEANKFEQKLTQQTDKYLNKLQRQEEKLKRKLWRTDSIKAKEVFGDIKGRYNRLRTELHQTQTEAQQHTTAYNGHLDSLGTAMKYLQNNLAFQQAGALQNKVGANVQSIASLKNKLNQTDLIRKQIQQRQQELKAHLQNTPLAKEFQKFKKEVYYYQAQVKEYQEALKDPKKLGAKLLNVAKKVPAFQDFFSRNSELANVFQLPNSNGQYANMASINSSFPTRQMVTSAIVNNIGNVQNPSQLIQQGIQNGSSYVNNLSNRVNNAINAPVSGNDVALPDYKVNPQKTKSFLKRLELGTTIQTNKANFYFPATSDLSVILGYKISDKGTVGIGTSGKIGWGHGWNRIQVTYQGVGLRSFLDLKVKGNFWITGGGEMNYRSQFQNIEVLKNYSAWQKSALLGISKKYSIGKKWKGNVQLLYDFLAKDQVPQSQNFVFRVGYTYK